jgi:hypothetical protein
LDDEDLGGASKWHQTLMLKLNSLLLLGVCFFNCPSSFSGTQRMPRKSKTKVEAHSPSQCHSVPDLDPTRNEQLHQDLWQRLRHRLDEGASYSNFASSEADTTHSISENISEERMFGKDMRRLLKLVVKALLNPGEPETARG